MHLIYKGCHWVYHKLSKKLSEENHPLVLYKHWVWMSLLPWQNPIQCLFTKHSEFLHPSWFSNLVCDTTSLNSACVRQIFSYHVKSFSNICFKYDLTMCPTKKKRRNKSISLRAEYFLCWKTQIVSFWSYCFRCAIFCAEKPRLSFWSHCFCRVQVHKYQNLCGSRQ